MNKIRYGVIGVGGVGKTHVRSAKELENIDLISVADINVGYAKKIGEEYNVSWYKDYREMIEKEELDAVSICVPHFLHASIGLDVISHDINVLMEKPITVTVGEADKLIDAAKKHDVKLGVCFQHRVDPVNASLKRLIEKSLGEPLRGDLIYTCYRDQKYYGSGAWRGTWWGEGGGVLINQAIHFIDIFFWLLGKKPKKIFSTINNMLHNIEVEDIASAVALLENNSQAIMQFSSFDYPGIYHLDIRFDKGAVIIDESVARYVETPILKSMIENKVEKPKLEWKTPPEVEIKYTGHKGMLYDFANAIIEDRKPLVSGEEGKLSIEVVNAIIMSGFLGRPVDLPLDSSKYDEVLEELRKRKTVYNSGF
ncbi:MAG TPA: Gfo/Idh/MocA family oxidoreductase [Thermoprotei archaeon]|nr:Gfo/Idh/MocA family oxidoreductase [Thermoprotei archaeon]